MTDFYPYGEVKRRLALEDIVGEVVSLKPAGHDRLNGLCPFPEHTEKNPSFYVNIAMQKFFCFGCGRKGDVFDFVGATQKLGKEETRVVLAQRAGISLPDRPGRHAVQDVRALQDLAQGYFLAGLAGNPQARAYLHVRGFTDETIATWGLGYAPKSWDGLITVARQQGVGVDALLRAGLVGLSEKTQRPYDFFRGRLTIPICDALGHIVGFSTRTLEDDVQPKYLNTSETKHFKKGDLLFGLAHARSKIRDTKTAVLVEGQFDVIAAHQAGYTDVVGAQTSSLTAAQFHLLDKLGVTDLYLAYDTDKAGQKATLAGLNMVARHFKVFVARLPGEDPAEVLRQRPAAFGEALEQALPEAEFRLALSLKGLDPTRPKDKLVVLERLKADLQGVRKPYDPVADELRTLAEDCLDLERGALREWLVGKREVPPRARPRDRSATSDELQNVRRQLMALALHDPALTPQLLDELEPLTKNDSLLRDFCTALRSDPLDWEGALAGFEEAGRAEVLRIAGRELKDVSRAFQHGMRFYTHLRKEIVPDVVEDTASRPKSTGPPYKASDAPPATDLQGFDYYLAGLPKDCSALDQRAITLTDYASSKQGKEQNVILERYEHILLSSEPLEGATEDELYLEAAVFYFATRDPTRSLEEYLSAVRAALGRSTASTPRAVAKRASHNSL